MHRERFWLITNPRTHPARQRYRDTVIRLLHAACAARGIEFHEIDPDAFPFDPERRLGLGDLLYRDSSTLAALRVEQFLATPGAGTFYEGPRRVHYQHGSQELIFESAGLPVPPFVHAVSSERALLDGWAQRLGGFPLLAKMGGSAGVGVILLESRAALHSFADYARALNRVPTLCAFVRDATLWRAVVVGTRAVAAYPCVAPEGDFRATIPAPDGPFLAEVPAALGALAVAAVASMDLSFGGVDVLVRGDERYVLESNFPCYFPHAQIEGGIDVAGAMVDHLRRKASPQAAGPG